MKFKIFQRFESTENKENIENFEFGNFHMDFSQNKQIV